MKKNIDYFMQIICFGHEVELLLLINIDISEIIISIQCRKIHHI